MKKDARNGRADDNLAVVPFEYNRAGVHSHKCPEMDPLKIIN
jgi:hypothetical protein